jgi:hypothetical protein
LPADRELIEQHRAITADVASPDGIARHVVNQLVALAQAALLQKGVRRGQPGHDRAKDGVAHDAGLHRFAQVIRDAIHELAVRHVAQEFDSPMGARALQRGPRDGVRGGP